MLKSSSPQHFGMIQKYDPKLILTYGYKKRDLYRSLFNIRGSWGIRTPGTVTRSAV